MQEHDTDPNPCAQALSNRRSRVTSMRLLTGALVLLLLVISIIGFLIGTKPSYANSSNQLALTTCDLTANPTGCTPTPTDTPMPTPAPTNTPTSTPTNTPTPKPTNTPTPKPTNTPPPKPTAVPTAAASPSATASVSPTATSTVVLGGGGGGSTPGPVPTSQPSTPSGNGGGQANGGFPLSTLLTTVFVLFGLILSAGVGWLLFRRMLMPTETRLKPSGARPWSRTRVSNPDSLSGQVNMDMTHVNAALGVGAMSNSSPQQGFESHMNNGYPQQGFEPHMNNGSPQQGFNPNMNNGSPQQGFEPHMNNGYPQQGFEPHMNNGYPQQSFEPHMNNGYPQQGFNPNMNNGYLQQGMHGYGQISGGFSTPASGFNSFSDSFVPLSPQVFLQGDASMNAPNAGTLAVFEKNNGYAPNSNAFNAMYGLPNDPFASSQESEPGWLDHLGNGQNVNSQQGSIPNNFRAGEPNMNDPYLAEVIRQYSQKSRAVRPSQPEQRPPIPNPNSDWAK